MAHRLQRQRRGREREHRVAGGEPAVGRHHHREAQEHQPEEAEDRGFQLRDVGGDGDVAIERGGEVGVVDPVQRELHLRVPVAALVPEQPGGGEHQVGLGAKRPSNLSFRPDRKGEATTWRSTTNR